MAALTSLIVLLALVIPLGGAAFATHTSVDAEPENDRNAVGTQHTITATTSNANQEVNFDVQRPGDPDNDPSDFECQTDGTAPFQCTYTYTSNTAGTDTINVWSDEEGGAADDVFQANEPNDQVQKVWVAAADIRVDCMPEQGTNPEGFTHLVTCTMDDGTGQVGGGQLDGEFLAGSANDPVPESGAADLNDICDAGESAAGQCTFTYNGNNPGEDKICFFVDEDANSDMDDTDCATEADGVDAPDDADVVRKTWVRQARLDIEPESGSGPSAATQTLTATFFDQNGTPTTLPEGQLVDFEIIAGPNANLSPPATLGFRDFECPSNDPTPGNTCTASYTDSPTSGSGIDVVCAWISHDGDDDTFDPNGPPEEGGDCDTEAPGTVDNDETDVVFTTWEAPQAVPVTQINAEPESETNPVGSQHIISTWAGDANNQPTTSTNIRAGIRQGSIHQQNVATAEINCTIDDMPPPGAPTFPAGQSQTHECNYTGTDPGKDRIRVFADLNGNNTFDSGEPFDQVTKIWSRTPRGRHDRSISIRFDDLAGTRNNRLVVFGRLQVTGGLNECREGQPVNVQRRLNGRWVTKKTTTTNHRGRYAVNISDFASRYRVVAPRTVVGGNIVVVWPVGTPPPVDADYTDVCRRALKAKRHRHRR